MLKKISLLILLISTFQACAIDQAPWFEMRPSYFFFSSEPMHEIYDRGGFELQATTSIPCCRYLDVYGSVGYRQVSGYPLNNEQATTLTVLPLDIGLKPIFTFAEHFSYFFAAGPRFFYFTQRNSSPYVSPMVDGGGVGLFVNTGFNFEFSDRFLLGIFGEYSYEKKTIDPTVTNVISGGSVQIGGFAFGLSLGCAF